MADTAIGRLRALLTMDDREFRKQFGSVDRLIDKQARQFKKHGKTLSRNFTLPILALGTAIGKMGADFEAEMTKIETLVGVSKTTVDAWRKSILDLAPAVGKGPGELARAMFAVSSAGKRGQEALDILEGSAKAAAIGLGDARDVALAVTAATTAYTRQNLGAAEALDTLVTIVREGNLEASELASTLGNVIAVAAPAGVSLGDVGAAVALITRLGTPVSEAVTQVAAAIKQLNAPTIRTIPLMEEAFGSLENAREQLQSGMLPVFRQLVEQFGESPEKLRKLLGSAEALNAVLAITSQDASEVDRVFASLSDTSGTLEKAFKRTKDTASQVFHEMLATLETVGIELAEGGVLDAVRTLSTWLKSLAERFRELDPETKRGIIAAAALVAALGPLAIVIGTLGIVLGPVIALLGSLAGVIGVGGALLVGLGLTKVAVSEGTKVWVKLKDAIGDTAEAAENAGKRLEALEPIAANIDRALQIRARLTEIDAKFQLAFQAREPKEVLDALITEREKLQAELQALSDAQAPLEVGASIGVVPKTAPGAKTTKLTKEQIKQREEIEKTIKDLAIQNDALRRTYEAYKISAEAVEAVTNQLEIEAAVRELGTEATQTQIEAVREEIKQRQALTGLIADQQEALEKATEEQERLARETEQAIRQPFENAAENIQREFGNVFTDIFRNGVSSFEDLGDRVLDIMARLAGEIATLLIFKPQLLQGGIGGILGGIGIGGGTGAGGTGGAATGLAGVIQQAGGILSGTAAGITTGFALGIGTGGANIGEKIGGYIGSLVGSFVGNWLGGKAGQGGIGGLVGGIVGNYILGPILGGWENLVTTGSLFAPGMSRWQQGAYAGVAPGIAFGTANVPDWTRAPLILSDLFSGGFFSRMGAALGLFDQQAAKLQLQTAPTRGAGQWQWDTAAQGPFGWLGLFGPGTQVSEPDFTQRLTDFFLEVDQTVAEFLDPGEIGRVADALQAQLGLQKKFDPSDFDDEISELVHDRLSTIIDTLAGESGFAARVGVFEGIKFGKGQEGAFVERAAQWLTERQGILDLIDQLRGVGEPAIQAEQAVAEIEDLFKQIRLAAPAYGIELADAEQLKAQAIRQLTVGFDAGIQAQIEAILNPYQAALDALGEAQEQRLREAEYLGADLVEIERLSLIERKRLLEDYAKSAKDLLLRLTAGPESPLAPTEVLKAAEAEFNRLRDAVTGGDMGQLDALVGAAENLLTVSRQVFASSDAFFERFNFVVATLQNLSSAGLQGFQGGGSFVVPGSGVDNVVPLFRASGGETVSISTNSQAARQEQLLAGIAQGIFGGNDELAAELRELRRETSALRKTVERQQATIERLARRKAS